MIYKTIICLLFTSLSWQSLALTTPKQVEAIKESQLSQLTALIDNKENLADAIRLEKGIALLFDSTLIDFPELGTYMGIAKYQDLWSDNSPERRQLNIRETKLWLQLLNALNRERLNKSEKLNHRLLLDMMEMEIQRTQFYAHYMPINQLEGVHIDTAIIIDMMPTNSVSDLTEIVSRIEGIEEQVEQTIYWMKEGLKKGVTPPKITLRDVPSTINNLLVKDISTSVFLQHFQNRPEQIPQEAFDRLKNQAYRAVKLQVTPAFTKLKTFIENDYIPQANEKIAMSSLPLGHAWYAFNVKEMTTTELTPKEIHDIGLREVARIRAEMEKIITQVGFSGDFRAFLDFLRTDPQFYFTDPEALLAEYRNIAKQADAELSKVFGHLPRTPYGVIAVPSFVEKSTTTAYYQPGSLETGRPGYFYANTYALDTRPKWEMEALTLHEAVPGHHLQIAIQQELEDVAWFRKIATYTGYVEGWGLYSESLGKEMGFYQDPYAKFGQLTYEMWRAIRLVVDTGMHAFGWSRQDAIDYFMENAGKTEHDITVEIDRYIVWPGQATAYKIGELKIKALREKAADSLGEKFDLRQFHDVVLGNGALPLTILESHVDAWINSKSKE